MSRYHVQKTVYDTNGDPLDAATVTVCVLGTTEKSRVTLYADASSATTLPNPLTSDGSGGVDFYLANPLVCDLVPVKAGVAGRTITVRPGLPDVGTVQTWDGTEGEWQVPTVQVRTTHVTSAQILALHTTRVAVWPAPASGHWLLPLVYQATYTPGASPYVDSGGAQLVLLHHGVDDAAYIGGQVYVADLTGLVASWITGQMGAQDYPLTQVAGQALEVLLTSALTGGDGTLDVTVLAAVV